MKYSRLQRAMESEESSIDRRASGTASAFGSMIRGRRKALKMRQDQLALATGVGRRFLIELEAGKPSCQLGRSLLVAEALGLTAADILAHRDASAAAAAPELPDPDLPDLPEAMEEPDGRSAGIF
jgi:transcriptional regulator with XRE-family HTH domain